MTHDAFDDLSDIYEALVDWPKRLARESAFYRRIFADHDVQRVVDVACGTGHHAAMFHGWELHVEGADASTQMIERARERFGEPPGLRWTVRDFTHPLPTDEVADAVICVGNSLALASDQEAAQLAVREMLQGVRVGGIVILHLLNLWAFPDGPCVWQKCVEIEQHGQRVLVTKGVHRSGTGGFVDLIVSSVSPPQLLTTESVPLLGITADQLDRCAQDAGGHAACLLGDYQRTRYEEEKSPDLIAVLQRDA